MDDEHPGDRVRSARDAEVAVTGQEGALVFHRVASEGSAQLLGRARHHAAATEGLGDLGVAEGMAELGADEALAEIEGVVLFLRAPLAVAEYDDGDG